MTAGPKNHQVIAQTFGSVVEVLLKYCYLCRIDYQDFGYKYITDSYKETDLFSTFTKDIFR